MWLAMLWRQALEGAKAGIQRLQSEGVAWLRPHDYYAEMVKSDGHMARIKQQLVYEQKQIEEADERWVFDSKPDRPGIWIPQSCIPLAHQTASGVAEAC